MAGDYDYVFKVLVLGDSSVGKSSLIKRFHSNVFDQRLPTTIGVDFFIHDMEVDGKKVKVSCQVYFFGFTYSARFSSLKAQDFALPRIHNVYFSFKI